MTEEIFQLVFRGEVLDGQARPAVIERIGALLKLDHGQTEALFSGRTVVLKRQVTKSVAARYLAAFRSAGARLRVLPARDSAPSPSTEIPASSSVSIEPAATHAGRHADDPRPRPLPGAIDVGHLSAAPPHSGSFADVLPPAPPPPAPPDVSHLAVDPPGADLSVPRDAPVPAVDLSRLTLAAVGADIGPAPARVPPRAAPDYGLLPAGSHLDTIEGETPPPPPDVSHLALV